MMINVMRGAPLKGVNMMKLRIFKNEDDYIKAVRNEELVNCYKATVLGYEYTIHENSPFSYIDSLGEKHSISSVDIAMVGCSDNIITVILNIDPAVTNYVSWNDIIVLG